MLWNIRKPVNKILSLILVCALSVSLLSGCGQAGMGKNGSGTETDATKETQARQETENRVQSAGAELATKTEETEKLLTEISAAIEKKQEADAKPLVEELSEQLSETKEDTEKWLLAQQDMSKDLTGKAAETLKERQAAFEKDLKAGEEQAQELLEQLGKDIDGKDMEKAATRARQLEGLLIDKKEPKTYGEELPGEVPVQEAGEEDYAGDTQSAGGAITENAAGAKDDKTVSKGALGEAEDNKLLVTEGDTALNDRITKKAEELGSPLAIYNYLKNNIGYETYYGSRKGAAGTLDAMNGNDMDQASLLIAMFRHLGYPAEYVKGNILLTGEQAMSLTGVDTPRHASDVLAAAGTPVTRLTRGEEIVYIRMEHIWVRAYVPYTDYRGAGNAEGESIWIDLDTGIKAYEAVENIYDTLEEEGFSEELESLTRSGDSAQIEALLDNWEEKLSSMDTSGMYARKRIIRQKEESYLPLSLQYEVETQAKTFAQVENSAKDRVSFEVNGDTFADFTASELQGKDILLTFQPASAADKEIYDSYSSIFDIPAYAVHMKPVLLVDGEIAAKGEEYLETTLGTKESFTIHLSSGGKNTTVTNDVTTGSMYAVTLDSQSITAEELRSVYDEAAALKDSVTEANVYSEEYLGKLLALAGKLYFAQVDIAHMVAADSYGVLSTRSLSEGITGYEVRTSSLYGRVTGLSEGNLYIDVDTDSHNVVSLSGDTDVPREYMMSTGMSGSMYESIVWEELTGYESVSTASVLQTATKNATKILTLSQSNLSTEIEKLNTDETTKQEIINAVSSGKAVIIPAENVTIGEWAGTGYIVMNPETGAGEYKITGGLNGGSSPFAVTTAFLADTVCSVMDLAQAITVISESIKTMACAMTMAGGIAGAVMAALSIACMIMTLNNMMSTFVIMLDYLNGDPDAGDELIDNAKWNVVLTVGISAGGMAAKKVLKNILKSELVSTIGTECTERLLREYTDVKDLSRCVKQILKMDISAGVIIEISEKFGKSGLDWILGKKGIGLTDDLVRKILKAESLDYFTDAVVKAVKNSDGYADDIIEQIIKYGDDAAKAIGEYGDDAVKLIKEYGDDAVEQFSKGKTPEQVKQLVVGLTDAATYADLVSDKIKVLGTYSESDSASDKLRQELYSAGVAAPPYKNAAHHIVPWNDTNAAEARAILDQFDIDYDSAANGVFLPMEVNQYTGNTSLHIGGHSKEYIAIVTERLKEAVENGEGKDSIIEALNQIRKDLLEGKLTVNKR